MAQALAGCVSQPSQTPLQILNQDSPESNTATVQSPQKQSNETISESRDSAIVVTQLAERVSRIALDKQPPAVQKKSSADTVWVFHIAPELAYDILSRSKNGQRNHVDIKITGVKMTLGLDLTFYLGESVDEQVLEHEYGHAAIARHKYAQCEKVARNCAALIVGRTYHGDGDSVDAACIAATTEAARTLASMYQDKTNGCVTLASNVYDQLEQHGRKHDKSQKNIEQAEAAAQARCKE